jgi:hypothetical protein
MDVSRTREMLLSHTGGKTYLVTTCWMTTCRQCVMVWVFVFQIPNACYARRSLACARSLHANGRGFSVALRNVLDSTVWDLKLHMYVYSCVIAIVSPFTRVRARIGDTNWGGSSLALGYMLDATVKILYCTCCTCAHTCGRVFSCMRAQTSAYGRGSSFALGNILYIYNYIYIIYI